MRVGNTTGIRNLCAVAAHLLQTMAVNAATKFAVRTVIREAINKSCPEYKGNSNRRNVRYISSNARRAIDSNEPRLIADHALPVSLALTDIYAQNLNTVDELVALVARFSTMVLITEREDNQLREAGLVKSMPANWDGIDHLARYSHVGIEVSENARTEA